MNNNEVTRDLIYNNTDGTYLYLVGLDANNKKIIIKISTGKQCKKKELEDFFNKSDEEEKRETN